MREESKMILENNLKIRIVIVFYVPVLDGVSKENKSVKLLCLLAIGLDGRVAVLDC